jgi:hypothetical protein
MSDTSSVGSAGIDRWNRFDPLRSDPSHQAPPLRSFAARSRSCTVALSWRGVPLPARAFAAWPIRVVLPSVRIGGAHGVLSARPSQACSRNGWPVISDRPGPRACSSNRAPRLVFVGSICRRLVKLESSNWRQIARATGLASGLDSRLRSVSPCVRQATMSAATLEDRSCHGLSLSQGCGHGLVHSDGLDPVRIIQPQGAP